jgi:ABC-type dipeptide/oligopeptide/nickel transport system permease component
VAAFVIRRVVHSVFVLWGVITVIFVMMRVVPSDPASLLLGTSATPDEIRALQERLGLNESLAAQYGHYFSGVFQLHFGSSYINGQSATHLVFERASASAYLAVVAAVLSLVVAMPLGILAARYVGRWPDRLITSTSTVAQAVPNFWLGIVFILIFARYLRLVPGAGNATWDSVVLPAIALSMPFIGILVRLLRGDMAEVMSQGYIQTARAKGLSETLVLRDHAVRNSLVPVVTVAGLEIGTLLGGAVVTETVFGWPGVGRLLVDSINTQDYSVVQAAVAFIAVVFIVVNLCVDLLYGVLDPRIRLADGK